MKASSQILSFFICIISMSHATEITEGPFSGIDLASLPSDQARIIQEANEDFLLTAKGKNPHYAQIDATAPLPSDGGTTFYQGRNYSLTVVQSLSSFGNLSGYIYGPVLSFDTTFASGNSNTIKSLRFYTFAQLQALKREAN